MKEKNMRNKERDDKKIKEYVLDKLLATECEFTSLSKQIDTMLKYIYAKKSAFKWMELEKQSEREVAEFIIRCIRIKKYVLDEIWPAYEKKPWTEFQEKKVDRRSLSKQIDTMLKYIYAKKSTFKWMELEKQSEREVADFIIRYLRIKQYALNELWPKSEKKVGEEYRSISSQVTRLLDHIYEKDSSFVFMELDQRLEYEVARFIVAFINRGEKNRFLYRNLACKFSESDYSDLIVEDIDTDREIEMFAEGAYGDEDDPEDIERHRIDLFKAIEEVNILESIPTIWEKIWFSDVRESENGAEWLIWCVKTIVDEIEKRSHILMHTLKICIYHYLDDLCEVLETTAKVFLLRYIIFNEVSNKIDILNDLNEYIDNVLENYVDEGIGSIKDPEFEMFKISSQQISGIPTLINDVKKENKSDNIASVTVSYVQFLYRQEWYRELELIYLLLKEEMERTQSNVRMGGSFYEIFSQDERIELCLMSIWDDKYSNDKSNAPADETENLFDQLKDKIKKYIKGDKYVADYSKKFEEAKQMMVLVKKIQGNHFIIREFDLNQICLLKIIFQEFFVKNGKYLEKKTLTKVRDILHCVNDMDNNRIQEFQDKMWLHKRDLTYLDAKIVRGIFCEYNMPEEFKLFNQFLIKYRNIFLKLYKSYSHENVYDLCVKINTKVISYLEKKISS